MRFTAFAAGGLALGVALVAWLGTRPQVPRPHPPPAVTEVVREVVVVAARDAAVAPPVPEHHEVDAGHVPEAPPPIAFEGERVAAPGRVAYLRCDGVPQLPGAHPCAREPALETAVWAVVATLPRCDDPPPGLGQTDLRLEFSPATPTDVHARDVSGAPSLDSHRLLACLAGPLSHVRSAGPATRLVVSFRFSLVPH